MDSPNDKLAAARNSLLYTLGSPNDPRTETHPLAATTDLQKVPVTVLSGFLGSGKTTLLCGLLSRSSKEIVAIVNDMATINVDAKLISEQSAETISLENGCSCCVLGTDLAETLMTISQREQPPDAIVIEASGISDPIGIAQIVSHTPNAMLDGVVTVVDGGMLERHLGQFDTRTSLLRQLGAAHIVVVNRLSNNQTMSEVQGFLSTIVPGRPIMSSDYLLGAERNLLEDILLGASFRGARPEEKLTPHDTSGFSSEVFEWRGPLDASLFCNWLENLPASVYRTKGWCWLKNRGDLADCYEVQSSGNNWRLEARPGSRQTVEQNNCIVVIGATGTSGFTGAILALSRLLPG